MAILKKKTDYRKKYPELSDEIINVLEQSDRKMEYQQYDLKTERFRIHYIEQTVICVPSREDSYDRLLEENRQFAADDESVEDTAVKTLMIQKMLECLKLLSPEERSLITGLFFEGKSERQLAKQTGVPQRTINDRKNKILKKLKILMEK
ncbi:MAG: sigma-70 family RNA polymerase sigma factor [Clostridia bacterium]|nr:sigma-70 family RNA polymerase sigma factor [Clostridia bacterium]